MFATRSTPGKLLAISLPVCLLWLLLGCVAVCFSHLEEPSGADAHGVSVTCTDENCPVTASASRALPERNIYAPLMSGDVSLDTPLDQACHNSSRAAFYSRFPASHDPPFERLCVLRI